MKKRVTFDFETRSRSNLKTEGAFKYSLDPTSRPTCLAFKEYGNPKVYFLDFWMINKPWIGLPESFKSLWLRFIEGGYDFSAHNAFFETCIYKNILVDRYGWPDISFRRFRCTAAKAAACALPRNLEGAGAAMKLTTQKDKRGYVAMMATCKPTKQYNAWAKLQEDMKNERKTKRWNDKKWAKAREPAPPIFLEPDADPAMWQTLYTYCKIDVKTEELLDMSLPDLIPAEQEIWFLNQRLNWRGLRVDLPLVHKIVGIMAEESKLKLKQLDRLTMGLITKPGAVKSILAFLADDGIELPNMRAKTVEDALRGFHLSEDARELLELRTALSKSSTKKYVGMIHRAHGDRIRDILLYHGASTGRDTGTGVQPHNFPRGAIKVSKDRPYAAVENVAECDPEMLRILYGESLAILFSSILRNMLIPTEGKELFVADFSKIEVAVLWWLSGNEEGLEILRSGKDPYIYQAAANLGKTYEEVEEAVNAEEKWALDARQLGKAQILGCGFGMGWPKFQTTAWDQYRLKLTEEQSQDAVKSYRKANAPVPAVWKAYEAAAIKAVKMRTITKAGRCVFDGRRNPNARTHFLWVTLPSGRKLAYADPHITWRVREYEVEEKYVVNGVERKRRVMKLSRPTETLEFWAVNSKTKRWNTERSWGGTLAENLTQACARDLMMPAMVRLEKAGYQALLMVHDEGLCEKPIGEGNEKEFTSIMTKRPVWAEGLPLEAKGWKGPRYRK